MYASALLDRAVKSLKSSARLWLAVVLISAGLVSAIWAVAPGGRPSGPYWPTDPQECLFEYEACHSSCVAMPEGSADRYYCNRACGAGLGICLGKLVPGIQGPNSTPSPTPQRNPIGAPVTQNPPPNATGPNSTPTPTPPRKYPIKGPPHKFGPNPTPSPTPWTGSPKPTPPPIGLPTPTPSATPRKYPIKGPPRRLGPSPSPSATAKPILLAKPKPTPSPKPTPKKSSHTNGHQ
jgi:hypothetical protein